MAYSMSVWNHRGPLDRLSGCQRTPGSWGFFIPTAFLKAGEPREFFGLAHLNEHRTAVLTHYCALESASAGRGCDKTVFFDHPTPRFAGTGLHGRARRSYGRVALQYRPVLWGRVHGRPVDWGPPPGLRPGHLLEHHAKPRQDVYCERQRGTARESPKFTGILYFNRKKTCSFIVTLDRPTPAP